ncbi:MAG TPA: acylneuraminate cytidylyltransferase family protein [Tepidisphaeraceae bacterium]|nr:acylneuraminate cytidylyltransferase family protein [Tepidisphaeraceae bacterium]
MSQPNIVAFVPMRHESKRVPGKNYRSFGGRPLYHHIIHSLLNCSRISRVVIDTDSDTIEQDALKHFPSVKIIRRPEHLRADTCPMNDVLLHATKQVDGDFYLQTHSTNPLLTPDTINRGINTFLANHPTFDSLFGVTRVQARLWDGLARAVNHNPQVLLRTQDLPPIYQENSCLYLFTPRTLQERRNRIGERPLLFEIDRHEAQDIDEEVDFRIAELMYLEQHRRKAS